MSLDPHYLQQIEAEVEEALQNIDSKYSVGKVKYDDDFNQSLAALSKEFDSLGLPPLDLSQPTERLYREIVNGARSLVNICRTTVIQTKNANTETQMGFARRQELQHMITNLKTELRKQGEKQLKLEAQIESLKRDLIEAKEKEEMLKDELQKVKRYYQAKEKGYLQDLRKLVKENEQLTVKCGLDINPHSKDEILKNVLGRYKQNEKVLKDTISKMLDENRSLLEENLHLRGQT